MHRLHRKCHKLRQHRSPRRACNAPLQPEDKHRIQYSIEYHRDKGDIHSLIGVARHAKHTVQTVEHMRNDISIEDNAHILSCVGDSLLTRSKEIEQFIKIEQTEEHQQHTQHHIQQHHITQDILRRRLVALPQTDRGKCRRASSHHRTEGSR